MRFFALHEGYYEGVQDRLDYLRAACKTLTVEFIAVNSLLTDYTNLPILGDGDMLYNAARGAGRIETILLNDKVTTFYIQTPAIVEHNADTTKYSILHEKAGLSIPKTIHTLTCDNALLKQYVEYLGGFPIVIKAATGTRGIGAIKIESWHNLFSTADYLVTTGDNFIMREFIKNTGTARIVVLGDKAIASEFRDNLQDDFRVSGTGNVINYYQKDFDESVYDLAIKATHLANVETSGVDIIFDESGHPFLLEVNFPHNFIPPQKVTGVDIAGEMVKFLVNKTINRSPSKKV